MHPQTGDHGDPGQGGQAEEASATEEAGGGGRAGHQRADTGQQAGNSRLHRQLQWDGVGTEGIELGLLKEESSLHLSLQQILLKEELSLLAEGL